MCSTPTSPGGFAPVGRARGKNQTAPEAVRAETARCGRSPSAEGHSRNTYPTNSGSAYVSFSSKERRIDSGDPRRRCLMITVEAARDRGCPRVFSALQLHDADCGSTVHVFTIIEAGDLRLFFRGSCTVFAVLWCPTLFSLPGYRPHL